MLHDISLYAKPGQKIAFVGATGAGKTTITNLINRFYDIADGKIRYDGININKIKKADLRRCLGMVLQDTNLFTGTVMENIRYGNLDATDEECIDAAKLANADGFIRDAASGLRHGADRRRRQPFARASGSCSAIARAAVADPPVMILDEATSSIDTRTESHCAEGHGRADDRAAPSFVIAHRLSTVQQLRRHHGAGSWPHHRAGQSRRPDRPAGHLLPPLHRRLRTRIRQCLKPDCAPTARRVLVGHAAWPGFYRRSATGLAARGSGRG